MLMNKNVNTILIILVVVLGAFIAYDHFKPSNYASVPGADSSYTPGQKDTPTNQSKTDNNADNNADNNTGTNDSKPALEPSDGNKSETYGSLSVEFNGQNKDYIAVLPFDNSGLNGAWETSIYKRESSPDSDTIYISLPSDVQAGDQFTLEDGRSNPMAWGPPQFCFQYIDKSGTRYSLGDNDSFDSFILVVDQWDGRNGYAAGRFAGELRPYAGDTVIFKGGSFNIKIRP